MKLLRHSSVRSDPRQHQDGTMARPIWMMTFLGEQLARFAKLEVAITALLMLMAPILLQGAAAMRMRPCGKCAPSRERSRAMLMWSGGSDQRQIEAVEEPLLRCKIGEKEAALQWRLRRRHLPLSEVELWVK